MVPRPAHSAALVTALQIPGEKVGVRRQAVSRATPLFRRSTFSVGRSAFTKRRRGTPPGRADACPSRLSASPYTAQVGLPVTMPAGIDLTAVRAAMALDKKRADGEIRFALPAAIGDVRTGIAVDDALLGNVLR